MDGFDPLSVFYTAAGIEDDLFAWLEAFEDLDFSAAGAAGFDDA